MMNLALELAKAAYLCGEVPVGAVITNAAGEVIAKTHNLIEKLRDPTAHAEILAIKEACNSLNSRYLHGCSLYVTLEPCSMCASALSLARIDKIYFGAYDIKSGGVDNGARIFSASSCHHAPQVISGIQEQQAAQLMTKFFKEKR